MWSAIVMKSKESENYRFIIHEETAGMLFQSGEWKSMKDCMDGIKKFREKVRAGSFGTKVIKQKGSKYYREYRDEKNSLWGYGTEKTNESGCVEEYKVLKAALETEGVIVNQKDVLPMDPKIIDFLFSLDGCGFKKDGTASEYNPARVKQWENPQFIMWENNNIKEKFFRKFFQLP